MTMPYDGELRDLLDQYRRQRAELGDMQREMREISATASAGQQAVRVTVDAQGDITDLAFPTGAYRRMAPAELASVLTSTLRLARAEAARKMQEVLARHNPEGGALDLVKGATDWSKLLPPEPPMPSQVRDALAARRPGEAGGRPR